MWSAEDRRGAALKLEGLQPEGEAVVDVELWPLERAEQREKLLSAFETSCATNEFEIIDKLARPARRP